MINITQEEANAINIITSQAQHLQSELAKVNEAGKSVIALIEVKYNAVFDTKTGEFNPKEDTQTE